MEHFLLFWEWDASPTNPTSIACFSQWFARSFTDSKYPGVIFLTAEHYMMHGKAMLFDPSVADKIVHAKTPGEAKQFGREIRGFDREIWNKHADDIVERASYLRFKQHPDLLQNLLDTGTRIMVEANPDDRIWGIGFSVEEAFQHFDEWGQNR